MKHGLQKGLLTGLTGLFLGPGCGSVPTAKALPGIPSGIHGINIEEVAEPADPAFLRRIDALVHYATSLSFDFRGNKALAGKHLEAAARRDPRQQSIIIRSARRHLQEKKPDKAIDVLRMGQAENPDSPTLHEWLGLAYLQTGQADDATAAFLTALHSPSPSLICVRSLVRYHVGRKEAEAALNILEQALNKQNDNAEFWLGLADAHQQVSIHLKNGNKRIKPGVLTSLEKARQCSPENILTLLRMADRFKSWGEMKKAEELYRQVLERNPRMANVRQQLADLYLRQDRLDDAAAQMKAIIDEQPTNDRAIYILGSIQRQQGKHKEASENFEMVIQLNPKFEPVYHDLAAVRLMLDQPRKTMEILDKARDRFKPKFLLEFYAAMARSQLHQYTQALHHFTEAETLAKAGESNRLNKFFYFQMGATHERNRDYQMAAKIFRRCIEMDPDYPDPHNYMGYMWTEQGIHLEEAKKHIEQALKIEPENPAYIDSMGWVLFKLNQTDEALTHLQNARQLLKEPDPTILEHIGDAHASLKQPEEAKKAWEQSLQLLREQAVKDVAPDAFLFEQLGNLHFKLNQPEKAKEAWRKSFKITPTQALKQKLEQGIPLEIEGLNKPAPQDKEDNAQPIPIRDDLPVQ